MPQWRAHSMEVVFHTLHRGQIDTRICSYLVSFTILHYYLTLFQSRIIPLLPRHFYLPPLSASIAAAAVSLNSIMSILA